MSNMQLNIANYLFKDVVELLYSPKENAIF